MKKIMILGLILSFNISAKTVCFEVNRDSPVAIQLEITDRLGRTEKQYFELMPNQYACHQYSDLKTKKLVFSGYDLGEACQGEIKGKGKFLLLIENDGCRLQNLGK